MTSTTAAATANRLTGIGRSARPTIPCAKRITNEQSKNDEGPAGAGPSRDRLLRGEDYLVHFDVEVCVIFAAFVAPLSINVRTTLNGCFFLLQPVVARSLFLPFFFPSVVSSDTRPL